MADRIVVDAQVLSGKPVIRGTRISVEFVLDLLAQGWKDEAIISNYPGLEHEDTIACPIYARDLLRPSQSSN